MSFTRFFETLQLENRNHLTFRTSRDGIGGCKKVGSKKGIMVIVHMVIFYTHSVTFSKLISYNMVIFSLPKIYYRMDWLALRKFSDLLLNYRKFKM
ncbi:hypothetical protein ABFS83_03G036900 [Erythranthe nasuta]